MVRKKQSKHSIADEDNSFSGLIDQLAIDHREKMKELEREYQQKVKNARKKAAVEAQKQQFADPRTEEELLREKVAFLELQEKEMRKQINSLQGHGYEAERQDVETTHRHGIERRDGEVIHIDLVDSEFDGREQEMMRFKNTRDGTNTLNITTRHTGLDKADADLSTIQLETRLKKQIISRLTRELNTLKSEHQRYIQTAEQAKEKACQEAHQEIVKRVEVQFQQANDVYVKLKKKYQEAQSKIGKLEGDLKIAIAGIEVAVEEKDECQSDLTVEVEKNASLKHRISRMEEKYHREIKDLMVTTQELKLKTKHAEEGSRLARKTLEYTIIERDALQENLDAALAERDDLRRRQQQQLSDSEDDSSRSSQLEGDTLKTKLDSLTTERDELKYLCRELMQKLKEEHEDKSLGAVEVVYH